MVNVLFKLKFLFDFDKSLTKCLIDTVLCPKHLTLDTQFRAVAAWAHKHHNFDITPLDVLTLIKYIEMYRSLQNEHLDNNESKVYDDCVLICPDREDIAHFTGKIRSHEAMRLSAGYRFHFKPIETNLFTTLSTFSDKSHLEVQAYDI